MSKPAKLLKNRPLTVEEFFQDVADKTIKVADEEGVNPEELQRLVRLWLSQPLTGEG